MSKKSIQPVTSGILRDFTISLEPVSGSITLFYAFIDDEKIISGDGTKKRTWSGKLPNNPVRLIIRVVGIGNAIFKCIWELSGNPNNQNLLFNLIDGDFKKEFLL